MAVEYRDEITGQIVRYIREKVRKKKITALKKVILMKREALKEERKRRRTGE